MVQIRVGDIILDLYEFDPPKLNFTIEDITDTSTRSEFTRTFRVPATPNNNEFFETAFSVNGQDFDVTIKNPAELYVNGSLFKQGELRLSNVYITRENERIDYEVIFFGVTRNFVSSIGQGTLNELNLSGYNHTLFTQTIVDSWQAYPEGGNTDGIFNGDVLYPLVDFGNTYNGNGDVVQGEISNIDGAGRLPFTEQNNALDQLRFKPWVRAKAVWDEIFNEAGFTYTSNFLSGDTFRNLYLSAHGNVASIFTSADSNFAFARGFGIASSEAVDLSTIVYDYGSNMSNGNYVVPVTGQYEFSYRLIGEGFSNIDVTISLNIRNNGSIVDTVTQDITVQEGEFQFNLSGLYSAGLTAGDVIDISFTSNATLDYTGELKVTDAPGEINIPSLLPLDYQKVDFIRDIITKFRLVLAPDKNNSTNFIVEPWSTYIATGELFDWTKKLDVSKDFKIMPLFYSQKSAIVYEDSEGGDVYNQLYLDQYEEVFGRLNLYSNNELLEGKRDINTNSIPLVVTQIKGAEEANNGMDNCIIPHLNIHESEPTGTQFLPIDSKFRFGFYNGIKSTGTVAAREDTWYIEDDFGSTTGFTDYPMISPYNEFPLSASTIDFNWQREPGFIQFDLHDENIGSSMYDVYWSSYINSLYDRWARRVTGYFVLNAEDLINFSFDDIIFIKDAYYYVEKIYDVPMGEKASVKVDLIKLLDNTPRGGTPIGPVRPRALQYTVDTSLGDGTTTVYNPELFTNTDFSGTTATDNVYQIDWGDGTRQLLYFADSPSFSFTTHTYSSGGTYTISILVNNDTPWRAFRYLGYLPVLDKVTAITDWGNQFGQIASPFRFSVFDQSNFTSVPGNLDTTNIAAGGTEAAFAQTSFTGDVTNFVNLSGSVNSMFSASDFNQDISGWDVSNITDMSSLFALTPFNQNISGWTTSNVTKMNAMFGGNEVFNQPIGSWDVSNVTTMNNMFSVGPTQSSAFNQPLNTWDTSSVTTMENMFVNATSFNQPLNNWDTSNVLDMNDMFNGATSFNQSLADWDISSISTTPGNNSMENMLDNCGMSSVNYDATLIGWEGQASTPSGVTLGAQGLRYTLGGAAEAARTSLITTYGWTINGDTGV